MRNLICCVKQPSGPFSALPSLTMASGGGGAWSLKYCGDTPISSNLLYIGAGGLITSEAPVQTAIHQPPLHMHRLGLMTPEESPPDTFMNQSV